MIRSLCTSISPEVVDFLCRCLVKVSVSAAMMTTPVVAVEWSPKGAMTL